MTDHEQKKIYPIFYSEISLNMHFLVAKGVFNKVSFANLGCIVNFLGNTSEILSSGPTTQHRVTPPDKLLSPFEKFELSKIAFSLSPL